MWRALKGVLLLLIVLVCGLGIYVYLHKEPDRPLADLTERWAQPPSTFIELAGMQVHLRDEGPRNDKAPIILIHGTSASLHTWDGWTQVLSQDRRVIRFDLPAFGLTGPEPNNNYTIERYAEFVVTVMDHLGIDNAILAGNSLGGYIAWSTAVLHPSRVHQLVLVDASGYPYESESVPIAFKISQHPIASVLLKDFIPKALVENSVKNVYGNPDLVSQELVERYYQLSLREGNRGALSERFKQTKPGALAASIPDIKAPTLILWGAKDKLIPLKQGERFNQEIQGSQLIVFDGLGHVPHEEDPQATVDAVLSFLD